MSAESIPKPAAESVSKGMILAIIAMLAIILVPAMVVTMPVSRLVVTIENMETDEEVYCRLNLYGQDHISDEGTVQPGEELVWSYFLEPGHYVVYVEYRVGSDGYYWHQLSESVTLSVFETARVHVRLEGW